MESKQKQSIIPELKAPAQEDNWEVVSGGNVDEYWKPTLDSPEIVGELMAPLDTPNGKTWLLEVSKRVIGLPSNVALLSTLNRVAIGSKVRITYLGELTAQKSGRTYKDYRVEVAASKEPFGS